MRDTPITGVIMESYLVVFYGCKSQKNTNSGAFVNQENGRINQVSPHVRQLKRNPRDADGGVEVVRWWRKGGGSVVEWFGCKGEEVVSLFNDEEIKGHTVQGNETTKSYFSTFKVNSLLPSSVCNQSAKVLNKASSLEVVNKYGPCIQGTGHDQKTANIIPSIAETLLQDQLRADSIRAQLSLNSSSRAFGDLQTKIPASGTSPAGEYTVTVGLGTPKKISHSYLILNEEKFDPTKSSSYKTVSCSSESCNLIAQEGVQGCSSSNLCLYGVKYGSGYTVGFLATETITITSSDVFENFLFGCGEQNGGRFNGASDIAGISVGGRKLPIDASVFTTAGAIIDSGTTLTALPTTAYSALSSAFQEMMTNYPLIKGSSGLQPCYDFSNYANENIPIPHISIFFAGGVEVEIDDSGTVAVIGILQSLEIYQQKTYEVVYDVAKGMLGFAAGGC
ncbi:unnamed protein product [Dovyalis caffra]|uniref:Xylanase inhibitor N-terminal domain-containing protein n=1 Tax=Dovyalis caffra TaxID=77055 RepID=A0AAV1SP57_9ROSI|nr:unnamed protein product [Dovyalis caffra]